MILNLSPRRWCSKQMNQSLQASAWLLQWAPTWRISDSWQSILFCQLFRGAQIGVCFRQNRSDNLSPDPGQFFSNVALKLLVWHWLYVKISWLFTEYFICGFCICAYAYSPCAWGVCLAGSPYCAVLCHGKIHAEHVPPEVLCHHPNQVPKT